MSLAFATARAAEDFTALTLEELSQIQVTSIARKTGSLFDTPAAAFVLTGEDIQRAGVTTLGGALRPVPGMQVGQIDPFNYAISTRGFNDATSSKLLVLMDGRSLYSQTFSGAYWNYHSIFFEDLDRLETIRGPGASLWGANAMNGVINIVSKSAFSTVGSLATVSAGDGVNAVAGVRHGWQIGRSAAARVYLQHQEEGEYGDYTPEGPNGWRSLLAGTRVDWKRGSGNAFTLIAELRDQTATQRTTLPLLIPPFSESVREKRSRQGGHLLGRWRHALSDIGELTTQASYERMTAHDVTYAERHHIFDTDVQLSLRPWHRHDILLGASARRDDDDLQASRVVAYSEPSASTTFVGAFVQDEITLWPDRLSVTLGTKMERNSFTGWELQPNVRALWRMTPHHRLWAAASQAARTPSRAERTIDWFAASDGPSAMSPLPVKLTAKGSPMFDSEHVTAVELGHRFRTGAQFSVDTALFFNTYRDVRGLRDWLQPLVLAPVPHTNYTLEAINNIAGRTYGGEVLARWRPTGSVQFEASASTLRYDLHEQNNTAVREISITGMSGSTPRSEYKLRMNWDWRDDCTLDLFLRHSDALPLHGVPRYTGVDVHVGWRPRHDLQVSLVMRDALDSHHPEAPPTFLGGVVREIPRSYFVRVTYRR